ncbi:hypothetical protein FA95DRAFT_681729 [Auriscalpium vulgare]|uniref:Uncharacterized protein n=1 Tax=Auriscalpium vulgare TaxID=40419 RepID=A0ACB8RCH3_9AGAM|nr:hypothetical protein FA95DRAFT_681729 [Auriscalpium vulgare]
MEGWLHLPLVHNTAASEQKPIFSFANISLDATLRAQPHSSVCLSTHLSAFTHAAACPSSCCLDIPARRSLTARKSAGLRFFNRDYLLHHPFPSIYVAYLMLYLSLFRLS